VSDEVHNASDEAQVKGRRKQENLRAVQDAADLNWVMADPRGRRFMWRLMGFCGIHQDSFSTNALTMANAEGRRKVGLFLEVETLTACPGSFLAMQAEAQKESA
jgi:hypothetical protein